MPPRIFSPYEINHLRKHGYVDIDPMTIGEKPVEYLTGHADFCGLDFLVNSSTLIPRIESEKIVQLTIDLINQKGLNHPVIADVGTGSGCLGLSIAYKLNKQQTPYTIYLSDISPEALQITRENTDHLLTSPANIFFQKSYLLADYPHIKFDIIVAKLPYIPSKNLAALPPSVKEFEPVLALDGGSGGVILINRLLRNLPYFLSPQGYAILEFDDTHTLKDFVIPSELKAKTEDDLYGIPRFLIISVKS